MSALRIGILPVTALQQNCTIVWDDDSKAAIVIDPGGDVPVILEVLEKEGLKVEKVVLTHGHIDHAGGAAELAEALGVQIEGPHEADGFLLQELTQSGAMYGLTEARNVTPDRWFKEGDTLTVGDVEFDVLHCPGHTPGHVIFVNPAAKLAIVGDVLFKGSIGRTDFPYGDHAALIDAIKTKLLPLGDEVNFVCGHGPPGVLGEERRTNPFLT